MTRFQVMVVALCLVMNVVEGFDILVMAFAASGVAAEWHLTASQVGLLLSSGLIGMALGSALVAPLADRIGRRPLTLACLAVATVGMFLSALTTGGVQLGLCRVLTGIGVGGVIASLPVIIAEYSSRRGRGTSTAFFAVGLPLGGVVGGTIAALVTAGYGWRATFLLGAVLSLVTVSAMAAVLPESIDYLAARRPAGSLARMNTILARMRIAPLDALPAPVDRAATGVGRNVLRGRNGIRSVLLWVAFFCLFAATYFAGSWTPRLLEQSGLSAQQGISGGILLNAGGVVGVLIVAALALRVAVTKLAVAALLVGAVAFGLMTMALGSLGATMAAAVLVGLLVNANGALLYAVAPSLYPVSVRTTAVGWALAVGRVGAIVAPLVAGALVDAGWSGRGLFGLFAVPLAVAAVAVAGVTRLGARRDPTPELDQQHLPPAVSA
ncbi:MFS transporter [Pseudonocardia benzenivorans]|uniref:MFS transporter n=1 Tax=Pseudonocardia benzenivorans TaxID=228005 RepID=A0ABW3VBI3_9PSEU